MQYISKKYIKLPKRKKQSKKGDNGKVLVIGGSKDYVGAVALAGLAALRTGVDWVTVAAPEKVAWSINSLSPDLVTKKLKGNYFSPKHINEIIKLSKKYDVILIGNGIGTKTETKQFVKKIIRNIKKPLVIDADGIKSIKLQDVKFSILTPHKKEFEILLKNSKLSKNNFKKHLKNNMILLKGPVDQIMSAERTYYNKTGNAGMTKAGTGDVLAGLAAGFLAQNHSLIQSTINAAYFNGLIGDILLKKKKGFTYLASDMIREIKKVLKT
ncbi:NAD(P)H-hydrate dehydratase [Candidatus Woesearchaeota archaeon]|nr:NAD(P)H-hydrate dehydratase [Candidatus Woesearchaeota archaeon]|tara:strand:- start:1407 stop:2213 length:807 start_codon:yes stop_codon:yes gene_type:complete